MKTRKLTDEELIKDLTENFGSRHANEAAYRLAELAAQLKDTEKRLSRFQNCHIWEPGFDNIKTMSGELEVIIPVHVLRRLIGPDDLLIKLPCPQNTPVFVIQKAYCDKRDQDKCSEYCDGWDKRCPDNKAELEIIKQPFTLNMISEFGKTVFLSEAAAITAKALLEKEAIV